jgi:hypothetical protein
MCCNTKNPVAGVLNMQVGLKHVARFVAMTDMNLVTPEAAADHEPQRPVC